MVRHLRHFTCRGAGSWKYCGVLSSQDSIVSLTSCRSALHSHSASGPAARAQRPQPLPARQRHEARPRPEEIASPGGKCAKEKSPTSPLAPRFTKCPTNEPGAVFAECKTTPGEEGRAPCNPRPRLGGYGRTRAQGGPRLAAPLYYPAASCHCSTAINLGRHRDPTPLSPGGGEAGELEGGSPSRPADASAPPSPRFSSLAPSQVAVLSKFASPTPTHPARAPQLAEFKALLRFHPLRSPPPALDYSIRDYAFASSLLAKWGLCHSHI